MQNSWNLTCLFDRYLSTFFSNKIGGNKIILFKRFVVSYHASQVVTLNTILEWEDLCVFLLFETIQILREKGCIVHHTFAYLDAGRWSYCFKRKYMFARFYFIIFSLICNDFKNYCSFPWQHHRKRMFLRKYLWGNLNILNHKFNQSELLILRAYQ